MKVAGNMREYEEDCWFQTFENIQRLYWARRNTAQSTNTQKRTRLKVRPKMRWGKLKNMQSAYCDQTDQARVTTWTGMTKLSRPDWLGWSAQEMLAHLNHKDSYQSLIQGKPRQKATQTHLSLFGGGVIRTKNHKDHPNHKCRYTYFDVQHKSALSAKPPSVVESLLMSAISRW